MIKKFVSLFVLAAVLTECSHTSILRTPDEKHLTLNRKAEITLVNDQVLVGQNIRVTPDSTMWLDSETGMQRSIATSEVRGILVLKKGKGALQGLGLGALIGAVVGLGLAAIVYDPDDELAGLAFVILPPEGAGAGLLLGSIIGAVKGSKEEYILDHSTDNNTGRHKE